MTLYTSNIGSNELLHHIQESVSRPEVLECLREVAHLMQYNCGAFELVLDQSEPLVEAGVLILVGDFTSLVQLIGQYVYTLLHSLSTEHAT